MRIYHKRYFVWGIVFLLPLPFFALGILQAKLWQWVLSIGLSVKYLSAGLCKKEGERQNYIAENYRRVAQARFGKYAGIKTNLPWIVMGGFFIASLLIRGILGWTIPVWIAVCFVILLTISVFYSIGLNQEITQAIDRERQENDASSN